jgi:hypothetical protein
MLDVRFSTTIPPHYFQTIILVRLSNDPVKFTPADLAPNEVFSENRLHGDV